MVDIKEIITRFYDLHEKPSTIAKELNTSPSYITKIIQKDHRYLQEKEYRAKISKGNRKKAKCEWIRNKRRSDSHKYLYEYMKLQHKQSSIALSYPSSYMSDYAYARWNSSAYHSNSKGNLVLDRKLNVGFNIPKLINMNLKVSTQKYKNRNPYRY